MGGSTTSADCALRVSVLMLALGVAAPATAEKLPQFVTGAVWNEEITTAQLHPGSTSMITALVNEGGFGFGRMQIDFSLHVVHADVGAPMRTIQDAGGYFSPDCEPVGTAMPVPVNATIEGQTTLGDLTCNNASDDCHLLVVQGTTLYEAYSVTATSPTTLEARCLAIWYLDSIYPPEGRGDHCTSADAAGFPMAPLLFNADEVAASLADDSSGGGDLGHAIRFILPNDHMASDSTLGGVSGRLYVRPATHAGGPSGPAGSVPYGARLRLKSTFDDSGYSPAAKVILNTFKRYGMVLADGGNVALTAESDLYTTTKWEEDLGIDPHVFWDTDGATAVAITDFEVIDTGPRIAETYVCVRTDVQPGGWIFADGFESGDASRWSQAVGE